MANHGPVYGLSREVAIKNQARFNVDEAREILLWIEQCTEKPMEKDPLMCMDQDEVGDQLKDGVQLCMLGERLLGPGRIRYREDPRMPFYMMENISTFLEAIKEFGVKEISCFQTVDLYEKKQMYKVCECLRSLASLAWLKGANIPIPPFAVRMSEEKPRYFSDDVLRQSEGVISLQYGTNKGASQKGMKPYGLNRQIMQDGK